ncbi:MAG TPA: hypothetical protein VK742_14180 [Candidatus Sulfotelmatobacter sp.]|nr:hypothetical protein [Candidatus Sulfotelmatobacter sp.]
MNELTQRLFDHGWMNTDQIPSPIKDENPHRTSRPAINNERQTNPGLVTSTPAKEKFTV